MTGLGRCVVVTLEKATTSYGKAEHWAELLRGHPAIDRSALPDDLDDADLF